MNIEHILYYLNMSKGKILTKKKWKDFRKKSKKINWMKNIKFPRHSKMLKDIKHISMGKPIKKIISNFIYE